MLTIAICTYNAEMHLESCLSSIKNQKQKNVKLIVIDGNSTDNTVSIIKKNEAAIDLWISEQDRGVYDAMNKAATLAMDGWIIFLGADDRLMPNTIKKILDQLERTKNPATLYYGDVYRPAKNKLYDGRFSKAKLMRRNICQQAIVYPKSALIKYKFNLDFPINADHILNIETFFDADFVKTYIPICISYYEDESEGISRNKSDPDLLKQRRILAKQNGEIIALATACFVDAKEWLKSRLRTSKK